MDAPEQIAIGPGGPRVPSLGVGTWAWGDVPYWGYGTGYGSGDLVDAFVNSQAAGVRFFDTAEVYAHGRAERALGWLWGRATASGVIGTKFAPLRGRGGPLAARSALVGSLRRLGVPRVDLYQVHWADRDECPIDLLMEVLVNFVREGLVGAIGVSNFTASELREAHASLARRGVALASQQVHYSLLHRAPERDGVLDACRELGVTLIAYSPLEQGVLAGTYGPDRLPVGARRETPAFAPDNLVAAQPVVELLRAIGREHGDRPPEQVALNWLRAQPGVLPVVGVKTGAQAERCAGALTWALAAEDIARIDEATAPWKRA